MPRSIAFVIYFMARRASAVGLFSNFERLVELSESTSGVFLHIYILIIGKPPLSLPNKIFPATLLHYSLLFFLYASCMSFSPSLSCPWLLKGKKENFYRLTKVKKKFPAHLIRSTFLSHRFLIPHSLLALTLPIHFNFIKNLTGFLRLEILQSALTFFGFNLKVSRHRVAFKC